MLALHYKVRDWIRKGELDSRYINTILNCSDIMTKAVTTETADTMNAEWNDRISRWQRLLASPLVLNCRQGSTGDSNQSPRMR